MRDKNWDAKAWPSLRLSGKYNLHHDRGEEQISPNQLYHLKQHERLAYNLNLIN